MTRWASHHRSRRSLQGSGRTCPTLTLYLTLTLTQTLTLTLTRRRSHWSKMIGSSTLKGGTEGRLAVIELERDMAEVCGAHSRYTHAAPHRTQHKPYAHTRPALTPSARPRCAYSLDVRPSLSSEPPCFKILLGRRGRRRARQRQEGSSREPRHPGKM